MPNLPVKRHFLLPVVQKRENAAAWEKLFHELPFASPTVSTLGATPQEQAKSVAQNECLHAAPKQNK